MATQLQELETWNQSLQMELEEAKQLAGGITTTLKNSERREHWAKDAKAQQKAEVKSLSEKICILKTRLTREEEIHEALIAENKVLHHDNTYQTSNAAQSPQAEADCQSAWQST
jgi:predicted RNase H-like nuclease (RuvC/YqgF family)